MTKPSQRSLALIAALGVVVIGSLSAAWMLKMPEAEAPDPNLYGVAEPPVQPVSPPSQPPAAPSAPAEPEVNFQDYRNALFEITCARAKIEDTRFLKVTIDEIYARYGWDNASFALAQARMKGDRKTEEMLQVHMTECTAELARSLGPQHPPAPREWAPGKYVDEEVRGSGLEGAILRISLNDQGQITISFQGRRDGKGFQIPARGEIEADGKFIVSGNRGPHNARVVGKYQDGRILGSIQGVIHKQAYRVDFTAPDNSQTPPTQRVDPPPGDVQAGAFTDKEIAGGGIDKALLKLKVREDGSVIAVFQGKREGKGFSIPLKGKVERGKVLATGSRGPNNVRLSGWYGSKHVEGVLQGSIYRTGYRVNFKAK